MADDLLYSLHAFDIPPMHADPHIFVLRTQPDKLTTSGFVAY